MSFDDHEDPASVPADTSGLNTGDLINVLRLQKEIFDRLLRDERRLNEFLRAEVRALEEKIASDGLTGVFSRTHFDNLEMTDGDFATNRRHVSGHWLIVVDLDNFKTINDSYGHAAGDKALVTAAQFLRNSVRETDIVARLGGDEFVILLRGADIENGRLKMQAIEAKFQELCFYWKDAVIPITASFGGAAFEPDKTLSDALERADLAMYNAKRSK